MKNTKKSTTAIIGVIVIAVTLFVFFMLTEQRAAIHWTALFFSLFAGLLLFGGILYVETVSERSAGVFLRGGIYGLLLIYAIAAIILAIVFPSFLAERLKIFTVTEVVLAAAVMIVFFLLLRIGQRIKGKDIEVLQATAGMEKLIGKVELMRANPQNIEYSEPLTKLYEALRYSDTSTATSMDETLIMEINKLELTLSETDDLEEQKVDETIEEILFAIRKRTEEIKQNKRGGM